MRSYRTHNGGLTTNRHHSRDNNWRFWSNLELFQLQKTKKCRGKDGFFRWEEAYSNHSRQLAEVIPRWLDNMNFTDCEYKYGRAVFQKQILPNSTARHLLNRIPHIDELINHLEVGYPDMIGRYRTIQTNHQQRSLKIKEIMTAQYKKSFQKIIIDRISSSCPKLRKINELMKRNKNILLEQQYNVYDDISIFEMVFTDLFNRWQPGS
jgi:hypothetical protein